jgi:chromate transporter
MTSSVEAPRSASLGELAAIFSRIGISSFGGGLVSWIHREAVERRKWIRDQEFLSGLALSQILPGPTMVNMTMYLGIQLRGISGALTVWSSLVLPPSIAIIAIYLVYLQVHGVGIVHFALDGIAATAVGLNLSTGIKVAQRAKDLPALVIAAGVFAAVAVLHWPMLWVVLGAAPLSLAIAWRRHAHG